MMLRDTGVRSLLSEVEGLRSVLAAERKRTAKRALAERRVSTSFGFATNSKKAQGNSSAVSVIRTYLISGPNETCTEPLSLAVEQFLEMVRFEQRARLAELPEELVRGQDVFL